MQLCRLWMAAQTLKSPGLFERIHLLKTCVGSSASTTTSNSPLRTQNSGLVLCNQKGTLTPYLSFGVMVMSASQPTGMRFELREGGVGPSSQRYRNIPTKLRATASPTSSGYWAGGQARTREAPP